MNGASINKSAIYFNPYYKDFNERDPTIVEPRFGRRAFFGVLRDTVSVGGLGSHF